MQQVAVALAGRVESVDVPLCIDCDGTLLRTDLLHEAVFLLMKSAPWMLLALPFWLLRGKAYLKQRLAEAVAFDWATLPLNERVVELAQEARAAGRRVVLATASHRRLADGLAGHLGLFDEVMATEGATNLSGRHKRERLVARFGERGFDYAGNAAADLAVWRAARRATVVASGESCPRPRPASPRSSMWCPRSARGSRPISRACACTSGSRTCSCSCRRWRPTGRTAACCRRRRSPSSRSACALRRSTC